MGNEITILSEIWESSQEVRNTTKVYAILCLICILLLRRNALTVKVVLCYTRDGQDVG
jgi:hypothetical protein